MTGWRKRHEQTLELVVTKSVCNEIAEQIQHLRGHVPYAGLTSKPKWYLRLAADENTKDFSYFKQSPDKDDFRPGASILWLQWMAQKPSPWQVANDIPGYSFIPNNGANIKPGQRGEVRKKDLVAQNQDDDSGWTYQRQGDNTFIRKRKKATAQDLKAMGKTPGEIQKLTADYKNTGSDEIEYLRWRHEATVVDVVEMIDGWNVLTFETGKIGLIRRPLNTLRGSPMVFVGYVPDLWSLPEDRKDPKDRLLNIQQWKDNDSRLVRMLDWNRILPGANLKVTRTTGDETAYQGHDGHHSHQYIHTAAPGTGNTGRDQGVHNRRTRQSKSPKVRGSPADQTAPRRSRDDLR